MMWSVRKYFLLCIFLYMHGSYALHSGQLGTNASADEPDLLHMLNFFKGKSDLGELTSLLKEYKVLEALGKKALDVCAPCKQIAMDAVKTSVGIRILYKSLMGQAPDIKDLYELATKGTGNMDHVFNVARKKNKKFNTVSRLFFDKSIFESASLMDQLLDALTGKSFTIDPALLKKVKDGEVTFTQDNVAQVNLLLLFKAFKENTDVVLQLENSFANPPFDFYTHLQMLKRFNTSTLSKLKVLSGTINDSKYAVSGGTQAFVTHPGAVKLFNDRLKVQQQLKSKSHDQAKAETLVIGFLSDLISLVFDVVKDAEH